MDALPERITIDPNICHGKSCIRGMRHPVADALGLLSSGMTHDEILADFEELEEADWLAAIAYAGQFMRAHHPNARPLRRPGC